MFLTEIPPGAILILTGIIVVLMPWRVRQVMMLAAPVVGFVQLLLLPEGYHWPAEFFGRSLYHVHVDGLSLLWGYIFYIAAFIGMIFHLHVDDWAQDSAALIYIGAAIGAVFSGDMISLFAYWEVAGFAGAFLIFARKTEASYRAGMRYMAVQLLSGILLLAGIIEQWGMNSSLTFDAMTLNEPGAIMIFIAMGIKVAFPLLHNWLQDAYPESTVTGVVFLSVFSTKMGIYALARGFPGTEELIWIGAAMTAFPIFFAVIENDLRRVLCYSLNNQLGYMVVGVGVGTEMALNGAAAHAFTHIIYKSLLFMSMGAVLYRVGTTKGSELGGLYKSMPWTAGFCVVGAASISSFPLFSGFISKALIITATADQGYWLIWAILLFAAVGGFIKGIKIPYFAFFAWPHKPQKTCQEAPLNMLLAMGIAAALCIGLGVFPSLLYGILPYQMNFNPYSAAHVVTQLQLLMFSALAFAWLMRSGLYPPELRSTVLDSDWVIRRGAPRLVQWVMSGLTPFSQSLKARGMIMAMVANVGLRFLGGRHGLLSRTVTTGAGVFWLTAMLGVYLFVFYF